MADAATRTSGQEPTGGTAPSTQAGNGYRSQADDAVNGERPGADGERHSPSGSDDRSAARGQAPTTNEDEGLSEADLRKALKAARAEAAENRKAKKELDALHQQAEDAKLSETEKLQKALAEAQSERERTLLQAQERVTRAEVRAVARDLGIKPELALRLIDLAAIKFDDAGDPTNIDALLQQAMTEYGLSPTAKTSSAHPSAASAQQNAPRTGATNPPRSGQIAGGNGTFAANERPRVTDPRLWKRS